MASVSRFDLRTLLSACIHLARRGGAIIRDEHSRGQLGTHNKKIACDARAVAAMPANEVLTVADTRAQDAIITSLRTMFPKLRIVGEEGEVPALEQPTGLNEVPLLEEDAFSVPPALAISLTSDDTCLWIDPLDGTKEFVMNRLDNVSVLIGIAVCDRPVAGVILQPFLRGEDDSADGTVAFGAIGAGVHGGLLPTLQSSMAAALPIIAAQPPYGKVPMGEEIVIVMSQETYGNARIKDAMDRFDPPPKIVFANACGNKLLRVLRGQASAFVCGPGPSRWDTCAGEALLMAVGGKVTDLDGSPYIYKEGGTYDNLSGHIAARTEDIHARVLQAFDNGCDGEPPKKRQREDT